jgi:hypothetical protein
MFSGVGEITTIFSPYSTARLHQIAPDVTALTVIIRQSQWKGIQIEPELSMPRLLEFQLVCPIN